MVVMQMIPYFPDNVEDSSKEFPKYYLHTYLVFEFNNLCQYNSIFSFQPYL